MAFAKTIEISSESPQSFDDAVARGVAKAHESIRGIREAWVKDQKVVVENGKPSAYRVHLAVTFELEGQQAG